MSKKTQKQEQHIEILEKSQQLKFRMPTEIRISKHNALYQASIQLEELDYTKLYRAYSGIRKSQIEPRVLFKVLVCAYMKGVYSSRKIEELCRENLVFWCCTIKVDIENSKGQYIEKDKQEATKDGSESTKIQHGI